MSRLESDFALQLRAAAIPFRREVMGLVPRKRYRVDFLIEPDLVVECEGGVLIPRHRSRGEVSHSSVRGILRDMEKANALVCAGYRVLRVSRKHIDDGRALAWVEEAFRGSLARPPPLS